MRERLKTTPPLPPLVLVLLFVLHHHVARVATAAATAFVFTLRMILVCMFFFRMLSMLHRARIAFAATRFHCATRLCFLLLRLRCALRESDAGENKAQSQDYPKDKSFDVFHYSSPIEYKCSDHRWTHRCVDRIKRDPARDETDQESVSWIFK